MFSNDFSIISQEILFTLNDKTYLQYNGMITNDTCS